MEEKIKTVKVDHVYKVKKFQEDFRSINVMGANADFDIEPGAEKIFHLAKRVAGATQAPVSPKPTK